MQQPIGSWTGQGGVVRRTSVLSSKGVQLLSRSGEAGIRRGRSLPDGWRVARCSGSLVVRSRCRA